MQLKKFSQYPRKRVSVMVLVAVCAIAISSIAVAQTVAAVTGSSTAMPQDDKSPIQFKAAKIPALKAGVPSAFNLCNGQAVPVHGGKLTDAEGLKMDTELSPCQPNAVQGGNPPYHFQWATGSFPPLGMHIGMNGLLYGTPAKPPMGGYKPFNICVVDLSANQKCPEFTVTTQPAGGSHAPLIVGAAALAGVAAVVGAKEVSSSSSSSGGTEAGTCDGLAPSNACGPCSCTDNGTCNNGSSQCGGGTCYWAGPGTPAGSAPFCGHASSSN